MFPETVRTACEVATDFSINSTKALYKFSCNASWIFFTSSMILFAPVLFETERAQMAELEMSQKQRVSTTYYSVLCANKCNAPSAYIGIRQWKQQQQRHTYVINLRRMPFLHSIHFYFWSYLGFAWSWSCNFIKWWSTRNANPATNDTIDSIPTKI